jgi:hypothetical protein
MSIMVVIANKLYFSGRHIWDVPPSTFTPHRLNVWISEWLFVLAGTAIKISVLLFYRRLSVKFKKGFLVATWVGIVYNVLYLLAFTMTLLLICRPVDAYWNSFSRKWAATHHFHCTREGASIPARVGLNVLGDFYSTLLPLVLIFGLKLPLKQKLSLYGLFALGFLACALGVVRVVLMYRLLNVTFDFTWMLWEMWIWSVVELYVGIFAASAPALKPFFRRFLVESIGSLARYSRRRGDTEEIISDVQQEEKEVSSSMTAETGVETEVIGMAYGGDETELRERGFWKDMGHQGTRRFALGSSREGRIVLVRVREQDATATLDGRGPVHGEDWQGPKAGSPAQNWPMPLALTKPLPPPPPPSSPDRRSRWSMPSQASQQTIHVVLQLDSGVHSTDPAVASASTARLRGESQSVQSQSDPMASILEGGKPAPEIQSVRELIETIRHGVNSALHATILSVNRMATIKSNSGSIHSAPRRSRDFDPGRRQYVHGRRDGYTI